MVNTSGTISTIAGNGTQGYNGDGIAATSAELNWPQGVAVDGSGNVYIADMGNNRIREVNTSGTISTFAGNGTGGYNSDGIAATAAELNFPVGVAIDGSGNVYIVDEDNSRIREVNTSGTISTFAGNGTSGYNSDGIAATAAELNYPGGVAVDGIGNVYIGDEFNQRVREVCH
jgi:sugar lactone lactonase YvrE